MHERIESGVTGILSQVELRYTYSTVLLLQANATRLDIDSTTSLQV